MITRSDFLLRLGALAGLGEISRATSAPNTPTLTAFRASFGTAEARTEGDVLIVSTGRIERRWRWTGHGLATVSLRDLERNRESVRSHPVSASDWSYEGVLDDSSAGRLISLTAVKSDDEGFTSPHLAVATEIEDPAEQITVKYVIWSYPGAPGLRTQLWVKGRRPGSAAAAESPNIVVSSRNVVRGEWSNGKAELLVRVTDLRKDREYVAGLTWWNPDQTECKQEIELRSVDGEAKILAVPGHSGPRMTETGHPEPVMFPIPDSVRPDGTTTVSIRNLNLTPALVGEFWLYQSGPADPQLRLEGPAERLETLRASTPTGMHLAAYGSAISMADSAPAKTPTKRADHVEVDWAQFQARRYIGYYNDTQRRNTPQTELLREEVRSSPLATGETVDWASIAGIESPGRGLLMVKESHKCVNQPGVDTGVFVADGSGLHNTGWALSLEDLKSDKYQWCWASWIVCHDGTEDGRELALKQFDRLRYPPNFEREMYTLACTWGNCLSVRDGQNYATEKQVLPEMDSAADLGIDMLLIDEGWEVSLKNPGADPDGGMGWKPHPEAYPEGWKNVIARKEKLGLRLGLWFSGWPAPLADMKWNWDQLHFDHMKIDFLNLPRYSMVAEIYDKLRRFDQYTGRRSAVSMDVTENAPRFGYFWGRDLGIMYLMNRKPALPESVVYIPWLALRDFWHLSRYQNLNKWQLTIQNPEVVKQEVSDAAQHSISYCTATGFMGVPDFMLITRLYSEHGRKEVRDLLSLYKTQRREIFDALVFPIGEKPSNAGWSGFQAHNAERRTGHLLIFRERLNGTASKNIALRFLPARSKLSIQDVRTGDRRTAMLDERRAVRLEIARPGDFLFAKYSW